jgi:hypothetical protein
LVNKTCFSLVLLENKSFKIFHQINFTKRKEKKRKETQAQAYLHLNFKLVIHSSSLQAVTTRIVAESLLFINSLKLFSFFQLRLEREAMEARNILRFLFLFLCVALVLLFTWVHLHYAPPYANELLDCATNSPWCTSKNRLQSKLLEYLILLCYVTLFSLGFTLGFLGHYSLSLYKRELCNSV